MTYYQKNVALTDPTSIEIQLEYDTKAPRLFGKKIKAAGGSCSACRGWKTTRYIHLPINADTRPLINAIVHECGNPETVMIARNTDVRGSLAWMDVHRVPRREPDPISVFLAKYWKAIEAACSRGLCGLTVNEPVPEPTKPPAPAAPLAADATSRATAEALCVALGVDPAKHWGQVNDFLCDAYFAGQRAASKGH